ncbi:MAG: tripartite tricarboxylate transporter substrate-binding protein [Burkholderiales bacterium]
MKSTLLTLCGYTLALACSLAHAQSQTQWQPTRPVQVIVPNPPGGGPDFIVRLIAPRWSEAIKQNIVIDNRASNNGIVGAEAAARGAPDGTSMIIGNSGTHAINASLYRKLPYDPVRDFVAVSEIAAPALVLVTHPSVPARNLKALIAIARQSPGKLNIAVAGATGEIAGNAIMLFTGIDMKNIPYKGGAPATIAVLSGESDMTFTNYVAVARHIDAGKLRILGISSTKRSPHIPNVPTIAEGGLEGYGVEMWYGLFMPAKTPPAVVQAVYRETSRIVALPDVREKLEATGHSVTNSSPEIFSEKVKLEVEKFRKIIVASKMQQD